MEYHSFLFYKSSDRDLKSPFPSPYGVSFILILGEGELYKKFSKEFPSPCGLSFILMKTKWKA